MIHVEQLPGFVKWLGGLRDRGARAQIQIRIARLSLGLTGDVKPVGEEVCQNCASITAPDTGFISSNAANN